MSEPLPTISDPKKITTWGIIEDLITDIVNEKKTPSIHYGFVLDKSGSMEGNKYGAAINAIKEIFNGYKNHDKVFMIQFDNEIDVKLTPTLVGEVRKDSIDYWFKTKRMGGTAIWDAIKESLSFVQKDQTTIINVITDGDDRSSKNTESDIKNEISKLTNVSLNIVMITDSDTQAPVRAYQNVANGTYTQVTSEKTANLAKTISQAISSSQSTVTGNVCNE